MIEERHRHRYEVNMEYIEKFEEKGFMFVSQDETGKRQEIIELKDHPYFVGTQYHPEFKSRPFKPSPPFLGFDFLVFEYLRCLLVSIAWIFFILFGL